jgi:pSer/pThr/pTyr-binding forkhead associated (FHA) protein
MSANVKITTELKNPTEVGIHYRILCMTGPNKGKVYYLVAKRVVLGRGETADIQIVDTKISREHAEFSFSDNTYTITDLGAQNGIVVNDRKVKQQKIKDGDKIVIGQSVLKFNVITVSQSKEMAIAFANPDSAMAKQIKKGVKVKAPIKHIKELEDKLESKVDIKNTKKSRMMIFIVIAGAALFIIFSGDDEVKKTSRKEKSNNSEADIFNEAISVKSMKEDGDVKKKLETLVHSARREFREGNYFRAMEEYRLALLLSPNNGQASFGLSKAKQSLDDEISKNFEKGAQEQDSKKFKAAIVSYCSVMQLIKDFPNDDRYKNAMVKISAIESALGMEKGEIKCFEEKSANSGN